MGKNEETVINESAVLEILKGKSLGAGCTVITSRDMFREMRSKNRFKRAIGDDAANLIIDHFNIENNATSRRSVTRFLNSDRSDLTFANVHVRKRQYMDMSFEEDGEEVEDFDVSMSSQKSINDLDQTISDLRHQLDLRDQTIRVMADNHRARIEELQAKIKELENGSQTEVENFFGHSARKNEFKKPMQSFGMKCLAFGVSSTKIRFMLEELADTLTKYKVTFFHGL